MLWSLVTITQATSFPITCLTIPDFVTPQHHHITTMVNQAKRWTFTINNYTPDEEASITALLSDATLVLHGGFGREVGANGTPHLQGWFVLLAPKRLATIKAWTRDINGTNQLPFARAHLEVMRGTIHHNIEYCSKDGNYDQFGAPVPAAGQGARKDIDTMLEWMDEWIVDNGRPPTKREIAIHQPKAMLRYRNFYELGVLRAPPVILQTGTPRQWQIDLAERLYEPCEDERSIEFYIDSDGGKGKTWFQKWFASNHDDRVQILGVGKKTDVAFTIDETKDVFFFNIPRTGMEYFSYQLAESLKDRLVFSSKYESVMKKLHKLPHVVVFANEEPDYTKLSQDRYTVTFL